MTDERQSASSDLRTVASSVATVSTRASSNSHARQLLASLQELREFILERQQRGFPDLGQRLEILDDLLQRFEESSNSSIDQATAVVQAILQTERRKMPPDTTASDTPGHSESGDAEPELTRAAEEHAFDAGSLETRIRALVVVAILSGGLAAGAAFWYSTARVEDRSSVFIGLAILLLVGSCCGVGAYRLSREALELHRLGRQFRALPEYLAGMPTPATRELMRATMTQRLFPRILADDDPLREHPSTPRAIEIIATIDPDLAQILDEIEHPKTGQSLSAEVGTLSATDSASPAIDGPG